MELTHAQLRACELPIQIVSTPTASAPLVRIAAELDQLLGNSAQRAAADLADAAEALLD
ncbi:MAG: hypothetical protein NTZ58_08235 [Solirubrobacterales bacterium]|nr:hypothetical protein [Solirubrobacterales bacterium]